jgi:hypothetical protein
MGTIVEEPVSKIGNPSGRAGVLSQNPASCLGRGSIDNYRSRRRRARRSRGCRSGASPRPGVHATQSRLSHRCHYWLHRDGYLRLCRNRVLSECGPHMASSFGCCPYRVVCAQLIIRDFTHYGRRLARGLRAHVDARSCMGDLRHGLTLARAHEAPSQDSGRGPSSLDSLAKETSFCAEWAVAPFVLTAESPTALHNNQYPRTALAGGARQGYP